MIGDFGAGAQRAAEGKQPDEEGRIRLAPSCYLLRGAQLRERHGMLVASLSGKHDALLYGDESSLAAADVQARGGTYLKAMVEGLADKGRGKGVDLLLTNEWPAGVGAAAMAGPPDGAPAGESAPRLLAEALAPRYHLAGGSPAASFLRAPYTNASTGSATRFIALAAVGATPPAKWIHALGVEPSATMDTAKRRELPQGATSSPYDVPTMPGPPPGPPPGMPTSMSGSKRGAEMQPGWRYQGVQMDGGAGGGRGQKRPRPSPSDPAALAGGQNVFVRNLAAGQVSEAALQDFFERGGCTPVAAVRLGMRQGRPANYAHVDFGTHEAAARALGMHGQKLLGREVYVEPAKGKGVGGGVGQGQAGQAGGGATSAGPSAAPPQECWFCLSNPAASLHLVASVGGSAYLAIDKGPMVKHHVLAIPIDHTPCAAMLPPPSYAELEHYVDALSRCFREKLDAELVCFERFLSLRGRMDGNHCHLNCVPVPAARACSARALLEQAASGRGFAFETELPPGAPQQALQMAARGGEYFCVRLPDGTRLVHAIPRGERHPMGFGREAMADVLGLPQAANWKECKLAGEKEETRAAEEFKAIFEAFDPAAQ